MSSCTELPGVVESQRQLFAGGATRDVGFRRQALCRLRSEIERRHPHIGEALEEDLGKNAFEAYASEVGLVLGELDHALSNLKEWTSPEKVRTPLVLKPSKSYVVPEPLGVCLIISPWNYPFQLALTPLVGAVAAGNCVVVKPSESAPAASKVVFELCREVFEPEHVAVVEGGVEVGACLIEQKFDHIFFTGSAGVGRIVLRAAAEKVIPVTLELGGKSPCIVDDSANLELAARRIAWGKYMNAGQTCVAPDFVLVHDAARDELLGHLRRVVSNFYGKEPRRSPDYGRIINEQHFDRLMGYLEGANIYAGGESERSQRYIAPTIILDPPWEEKVMREEIFGPILPVLTWTELDDVIGTLRLRPRPLALYLFTKRAAVEDQVTSALSFGGGCINDTVVHAASPYLPFGGVEASGMGRYHGRATFDTFTHYKSIVKGATLVDVKLRYPPHDGKLAAIKKLLRF